MPHPQPDPTWDQVSSLFEALVDLPPAERQARLRDAALPTAVVAEVQALLAASEDDAYLAKSPVSGVASLCQAVLQEAEAQQKFYPGLLLLNRYILEKEVAGGGQSVVYSARDLKFENRPLVAIKIYLHSASSHTMDLFRREASALAEIESSGCVGVRDHGVLDSGQPFLVMDWINGATLQSKLMQGALPLPLVDSILSKLALALDEAHRKQIIHRDLKPSNIILRELPDDQWEPVLIDFGIARSGDPAPLTGVISGTAPYMAPEQWTGHSSHASDQYSLALVVFEMLAGKRLADSPWEAIPAKVRPVLQKALAKEPERRYARLLDFSNAFALASRPKPKINRWAMAASLILALATGSVVLWNRLHPVAPTPRVSYTIQSTDGGKLLRLSLASTQPGFLYLVAEDPEGLGVLYPFLSTSRTSAALPANQPILVPPAGKHSIETEDPSTPDTFWIVWSREDPAELRDLAGKAQSDDHGLVTHAATVARVRDYLRRHQPTTSHEPSAVFSAASSLAYPITIRNGREIEGARADSTLSLPGGKQ